MGHMFSRPKGHNLKSIRNSEGGRLGIESQRDVRASVLVQETRIPSCGEAVKWEFEGTDLGKW